jgi:hypothetical protein
LLTILEAEKFQMLAGTLCGEGLISASKMVPLALCLLEGRNAVFSHDRKQYKRAKCFRKLLLYKFFNPKWEKMLPLFAVVLNSFLSYSSLT